MPSGENGGFELLAVYSPMTDIGQHSIAAT
jgi:hypothetical protein